MTFDSRWKNPPGADPQQLFKWAQDLITELRKGDYLPVIPAFDTEAAQDAVGTILAGSDRIDFTYNDGVPSITADIVAGSIGPTQLEATAVTPGSYTYTGLTVDADGRITAASSGVAPGLAKLTSGTVSSAATLDLVLTSYSGYPILLFELSGFRPATDAVDFFARLSANGGSSYDAGASDYDYAFQQLIDSGATNLLNAGAASAIFMAGASTNSSGVGNASTEGLNMTVKLANRASAAFWSRLTWQGYFIDATATPRGIQTAGGGAREAAQDTDAIRFFFSSGNIAEGNYAVYGMT